MCATPTTLTWAFPSDRLLPVRLNQTLADIAACFNFGPQAEKCASILHARLRFLCNRRSLFVCRRAFCRAAVCEPESDRQAHSFYISESFGSLIKD